MRLLSARYYRKTRTPGPTLEASSAKARWNDVLKKRYKAWRLVCEWSGAGGDGISELTEQAWQEIEQKHPECLQFKSAPFEFAKEMDECLQRKVASFTAAVTSTELVGHLNGKPTTTKPLYRTKKKRRSGGDAEIDDDKPDDVTKHAAVSEAFKKMGTFFENKSNAIQDPRPAVDYQTLALELLPKLTPNLSDGTQWTSSFPTTNYVSDS